MDLGNSSSLLLILCMFLCIHTLTVDEDKGQDSPVCLTNNDRPCKTLSFALNKSTVSNGTNVILLSAIIHLKNIVKLEEISNISIEGNCTRKPVIDCSGVWSSSMGAAGAGFVLRYISNINFHCLELSNCGAVVTYNNGSIDTSLPFRSAIYLYGCTNVNISTVDIMWSNGIGLAMFDVLGSVNISNSHFHSNEASEKFCDAVVDVPDEFKFMGGGGIHMNISSDTANNSTYSFVNCTFVNNTKQTLYSSIFYPDLRNGAGILLRYQHDVSYTQTYIVNCTFTGNSASWGGGMFIGFLESAQSNSVFVNNSTLENNVATYYGGGGVDIGFYLFHHNDPAHNNEVSFTCCVIKRNKAFYGAGSTLFSDPYLNIRTNGLEPNRVSFNQCMWTENSAVYSAAVDVSPYAYGNVAGGFLLEPSFTDCSFVDNFNDPSNLSRGKYHFSSGTFLITAIDVFFHGLTSFTNNNDTALQIVSSSVSFSKNSVAMFVNNSGLNGGAVALLGLSYFQFDEDSHFYFVNNSAQLVGGAVYSFSIDPHDYFSSRTCFFRYKQSSMYKQRAENTTFTFINNTASSTLGQTIFATSMRSCKLSNSKCKIHNASAMLNCSIANFNFSNSHHNNDIATIGHKFKNANHSFISTIPGKEFSLFPNVTDEYGNDVTNITVFRSHLQHLGSANHIELNQQYEYSPTGTIKLNGEPFQKVTLVIQTNDILGISTSIEVHLSQCPPGFLLNTCRNECVCDTTSYLGITKCNSFNYAYIMEGFWAGYLTGNDSNDTRPENLFTAYCPPGYCVYSNSFDNTSATTAVGEHALPGNANKQELDEFMCGLTRMGQLCGECQGNYSVGYHSNNYKCIPDIQTCNYGMLLYIASELFPLTLLFIVVLVFDISFTSGSINGFIFFAQVVNFMTIETNISPGARKLTYVYEVVYGFFNLQFFSIQSNDLAFCLWRGATALDVMVIKYATIVYALVLVLCMVFIMDYCNCHRVYRCLKNRNISTSVVQGLSAFLIMCYSQCVRVTFEILRFIPLRGIHNTTFVVFQNGNLLYLGTIHLMYAIPSILFLFILIIPPPLFLLVIIPLKNLTGKYSQYYLLRQIHNQVDKNCLVRLKPLFDSFQACYKDDCRCFAGLYLLYRLCVVTVQVLFGSLPGYSVVCGLLMSLIMAVHCVVQPYQNTRHNIIDLLIFIDLIIINYTSFYLLTAVSNVISTMEVVILWIQLCLVYLPIICFVGTLVQHAVKKCWNRTHSKLSVHSDADSDWPARLHSSNSSFSSEGSDSECEMEQN